jgi:hypothetical protein
MREETVEADTYAEALAKALDDDFDFFDYDGDVDFVYDLPADTPLVEQIASQNPAHYPVNVMWSFHNYTLKSPEDLEEFYPYAWANKINGHVPTCLENAFLGKESPFQIICNFD